MQVLWSNVGKHGNVLVRSKEAENPGISSVTVWFLVHLQQKERREKTQLKEI